MEIEERLREVLQGTSWVREVDVALRVVPAVAADLPPLVRVGEQAVLPVACAAALLDAVEATLLTVLPAAVAGRPREAIQDAAPEELAADPLVSTLGGLMVQTSRTDLGTRAVPALACAWAAAQLLQKGRSDRLSGLVSQLSTRSPTERGAAYASVAWSLSGRIAAAAQRTRALGYTPRTGGLTRTLLTTPLLLAFPAGTLRSAEDLALAAAMVDVPIDAELVGHLTAAVRLALEAAAEAPESPAAVEVASLTRGVQGDPLFTPHVGPRLLAMLPSLLQAGRATPLPAAVSAALTSPSGAAAAASAWAALLDRLLRWDVLSALCARIRPARLEGGTLRIEGGALPTGHPWLLLVPRSHALPPMTAVAVRLTGLRAAARQAAAERSQPSLAGLGDLAWERLVRAQRPDASALIGDHGVAILASAPAALAFARAAMQDLGTLRRLEAPGLGSVPLPESVGGEVSVGISTGEVAGAADGLRAHLAGAAVARAVTLCGLPHGEAHTDDLLGIRRVFAGPAGLLSEGITADAAAVAALLASVQEQQRPLHLRGGTVLAGGVREDFRGYPFRAWWEDGSLVIALLEQGPGGHPEAIAEVQHHEATTFAELHHTDAALTRTRGASAPTASAPPPLAAPSSDPFARMRADPFAEQTPPRSEEEEPPMEGGDPFLSADPFSAMGGSEDDAHLPLSEDGDEEEEEDDAGFGFMMPPETATPPAPRASSFSAGVARDPFGGSTQFLDGEDEDEADGFGGLAPREAEARAVASPMMMLEDEEDEEEIHQLPPPSIGAGGGGGVAVTLEDEEEEPEDWESETRVTPPMMLDDDDDSVLEDGPTIRASPPMILDDDDPSGFSEPSRGTASYASVPSPREVDPGPAVMIDDDDESELEGGSSASEMFLNTDIARMFRGYVVLDPQDGELTFGLLDERTLRDAHSYPVAGGLEAAYQGFLRDKLKEGFVPQVHRMATLSVGTSAQPLDMGSLERAYQKMLG